MLLSGTSLSAELRKLSQKPLHVSSSISVSTSIFLQTILCVLSREEQNYTEHRSWVCNVFFVLGYNYFQVFSFLTVIFILG